MRTLLFLLLAPFGALAQSTPYYLADGLNDFSNQQFRGTNPLYVRRIGTDSLVISTSADVDEHASEYRRGQGETFFRRTREWGTSMPNFVFLDEKSMCLVEEGGSYLLFLQDRDSANDLLNATDKGDILRLKDSLRSIVVAIDTRGRAEAGKSTAARNKKVVTDYMRRLRSKRSDPTLIRDIRKWSRNETTSVFIIDDNFYITRNYRGEVQNENIPAIIRYSLNGKCYIQWRAFGYEALGGGTFGKDLNTYTKTDYYIQATGAGGSLRLEPGIAYEIECN